MGFPLFFNFRCTYQVSIRKWQIAPEFKADGGFEPEEYMGIFRGFGFAVQRRNRVQDAFCG
jgi:hypothetical protein